MLETDEINRVEKSKYFDLLIAYSEIINSIILIKEFSYGIKNAEATREVLGHR